MPESLSAIARRAPRTLGTLLLAWLAARAAVALGLPVPWMIGPLLATALATLAGAPTHSEAALRNAGQWAIGAALGLYFTPEVTRLVLSLWWAVALGIDWALLLGLGFGLVLRGALGADRQGWSAAETRATMYFSGAVGGAS